VGNNLAVVLLTVAPRADSIVPTCPRRPWNTGAAADG